MTTLLRDHCTGEVALEQAAKLFVDVRELDLATEVVMSTEPLKWPARALAQITLKILDCTVLSGDMYSDVGFRSVV